MNCKPGDLAVVIRADHPQNVGAIVTVRRQAFEPGTWYVQRHGTPAHTFSGPCWEPWCFDYELRPIRPDEGEDETLTWAGRPSDIKTPEAA